MSKSTFALLSAKGLVIPQNLEDDEAGAVICSMMKDKAIILPFICHAEDSRDALEIYNDKVKGNLDLFTVFLGKESFDVR
ncbi:hypothetical protein [Vibrio sp. VB16]|uniref:hypothetical protein n=1 Tax=Vibrio sp. VB16 TaxID=2785746 RepID=UPI00189D6628|nr:hypothetical protein [Vibrio sp. VB16]UGA53459.1 hypothetical protein IUZ65_009075 [Vibrio sp. VB16]